MTKADLKVCIVGLGYIGLPTAALLANSGYDVLGVDIKHDVVRTINEGNIHIVEPDLDELVRVAVSNKKLRASLDPYYADVFIIAVPTPFKENNKPDVSFVESAVRAISPYVRKESIIILESTSPVGTTKKISMILQEQGVSLDDVFIAYCPERVLPGRIIEELVENDRVVGGINDKSTRVVKAFYQTFVKGSILESDSNTAEMCKLVENAFRDVNIAFANELSMICDLASVDVRKLIELANHHPRVNILQPGVGVGGHCIAVDPWFLVSDFPECTNLIRTSREVNVRKTTWVVNKIKEAIEKFKVEKGRSPEVSIFGLSFKPDIDDLRESPALEVANSISNFLPGANWVEPNIYNYPGKELVPIDVGLESDIICILQKHTMFKSLKFSQKTIILDFCGLLS